MVISISSPIPGMPRGKPAGVKCVNLDENMLCRIYGTEFYPEVCRNFTASEEMCGNTRQDACAYLGNLEKLTGLTDDI